MIVAALKIVQCDGILSPLVRHLRGDIHEVRIDGFDQTFRILFAPVGKFQHVFLELEGFSKKAAKTSSAKIEIAEQRLLDWNLRGLIPRKLGR